MANNMPITAENHRITLEYPVEAEAGAATAQIKAELYPEDCGADFSPGAARTAAALSFSSAEAGYLTDNLSRLGWNKPDLQSFENSRSDGIGLAFAQKTVGGQNRVAVILRGTQGQEWYSNFEIGYAAEHTGFSKAADYAEDRLGDYLRSQGVRDPAFFVTGYSRGGAAANILSKRLCDRWGVDAVRAYTFAAPNTVISYRGASYGSIFNFVREEDFFARVPLTGWGYTKYGRILFMSGDVSEPFRAAAGRDYLGLTDSLSADEALGAILKLAPNVHAYYERRYPVGKRLLSLYEWMKLTAQLLAGRQSETAVEVTADADTSEFGDLAAFLSLRLDLTSLLIPSGGAPRCSLADSHSPAAYMAALEQFLKADETV